ncbi:hypothetical protein CEXT_287351 [Caerostris extrusa]|uniref:Uncharacterized protein n=1 Tax=Caerostris extrusa TaxID=172846 RepID=A0AAV4PTJ1_CAEEX|nr:hypothetical protein CEXT_287351 [Caerostris extrusa]
MPSLLLIAQRLFVMLQTTKLHFHSDDVLCDKVFLYGAFVPSALVAAPEHFVISWSYQEVDIEISLLVAAWNVLLELRTHLNTAGHTKKWALVKYRKKLPFQTIVCAKCSLRTYGFIHSQAASSGKSAKTKLAWQGRASKLHYHPFGAQGVMTVLAAPPTTLPLHP